MEPDARMEEEQSLMSTTDLDDENVEENLKQSEGPTMQEMAPLPSYSELETTTSIQTFPVQPHQSQPQQTQTPVIQVQPDLYQPQQRHVVRVNPGIGRHQQRYRTQSYQSTSHSENSCADYLIFLSICTCMCCCIPFGLVALFFSIKASNERNEGDVQCSNKYAIGAIIWNVIAIASGIIITVTFVVLRIKNSDTY